jgi:hypothetical protein
MQEWEDDGEIITIDTTMPCAQQGPLIRDRARQLNYQVKLFLPNKFFSEWGTTKFL